MCQVDVVLVAISSPILIGVYEREYPHHCIEHIKMQEKLSEGLTALFERLLQDYEIIHTIYTNRPGNFLGIKLSYIFLKSLSLCYNIKIKSVDGFYFNSNQPIKAILGQVFIKQGDEIIMTPAKTRSPISDFHLPSQLLPGPFSDDITPQYIAPAVY